MWLDAADTRTLTLNGSNISQWNDKSGNGYNLSQANASLQPAFVMNQLNGFGGIQPSAGRYLALVGTSMPNFAYGNQTSVFCVARNAANNSSWNIFATMFFTTNPSETSKSRWHLSFNQGVTAGFTLVFTNSPQTTYQNTSFVTQPSASAILGFTGSSSETLLAYNGLTSSYAGRTLQNADDGIVMAIADPRTNAPVGGTVFEFIGFNRAITSSERQQVEGYLAWKWGLQASLPATHPYKSSPIPPLLNPSISIPNVTPNPFFSPTQVSGCALWLDGADRNSVVLSGSNVSQWNDKSGNGWNATQTSVANRPIYTGTSIQCVSTSQQWMNLNQNFGNSLINNAPFQVFIVVYGSGIGFIVGSAAVTNQNLFISSDTLGTYGGGAISGTPPSAQSLPNQYSHEYSGSFGRIYQNGVNFLSGALNLGLTSYPGPEIGRRYSGAPVVYHDYTYSEIISFNRVLTTTQRQQIEGYLAWKWGLQTSLPTTHPYFFAPVTPFINQTLLYSPWLPTQISGCQVWLDAADPNGTGTPPANNTALSTWIDKSGSGNSMTAVGSPQPTYVSQSQSISYDGSSYFQKTSLSFTNYTFFAIARKTTGNGPLYTNTTTTADTGFFPNYTADGNYYLERGNTWAIGISPFTNGTTYMYSVRYAPDNTINVWSNGGINPTITTTRLATIPQDSILLGKRNVTGGFTETWVGTFSEVIQYNSALTTSQRQQIEGYLAWKWGLQANLPSNHPYFSVPIVRLNALIISPQVSSASWLPKRVSGCSLWLDAADPNGSGILPSNGVSLTTWADKSGNNYNVSQNASLAVPVFRKSLATNGLPGLDFTGGGGLLSATSFAKSLNVTMLLVGMVKNTIAGWGTFWGHFPNGDHDNNAIQLRNTSGQAVLNWHTNNNNNTSQLSYTLDSMVLYSCTMTNGNIMFMQQTNTSGTNSVTVTNGAVTINTNTAPIWVGRSDITGEAINSYIYEIVYFQRVLSLSERQQTEGYLAWKWGLQSNLPASHPFKNWPPPP